MTAAYKIVSQSLDALGTPGTVAGNELRPERGLWFHVAGFAPTPAELATESFIEAAIRNQQLFPVPAVADFETRDLEDKIYDYPSGVQKFMKRGSERKTYKLDISLPVHNALQSFHNTKLFVYKILEDGTIMGTLKDGKIVGFSTDMIAVGRMPSPASDGGSPAFTPLMINYAYNTELDKFAAKVTPADWLPLTKEALIPVTVGVVSATSSKVVLKVYSVDGYDSAGAVKEVLIGGIDPDDFTFVKENDTAQAAFTVTDKTDGTYELAGTGLVTGKANLKAPKDMTTTDLFLKAPTTPVTVTIS